MYRIGSGFDIHRLAPGRPFIIAGMEIESTRGPVGHSDGDALLHAVVDAILGALALGDIGDHFPPSDPQWKDAKSEVFIAAALKEMNAQGYRIENLDTTIILEKPKLGPHKKIIQEQIANMLDVDVTQVCVKAKTAEGSLGELGQGLAIGAMATVLLAQVN